MNRIGLRAVGSLSALTAGIPSASAQQWSYGPYMMWDHGWWGMFLGPFMMIALIAIVGVVAVLLVRWVGGVGHQHLPHQQSGRSAIDILKERFARGEIDKDEFEERRRVLGD